MKSKRIPKPEICFHCLAPTSGNWGMHRNGQTVGPSLPLCDVCGAHWQPSCDEIWNRAEQRLVALNGLQADHEGDLLWKDFHCVYCFARPYDWKNAHTWHFHKADISHSKGPVGVCPACAEQKTCKDIATYINLVRRALGVL